MNQLPSVSQSVAPGWSPPLSKHDVIIKWSNCRRWHNNPLLGMKVKRVSRISRWPACCFGELRYRSARWSVCGQSARSRDRVNTRLAVMCARRRHVTYFISDRAAASSLMGLPWRRNLLPCFGNRTLRLLFNVPTRTMAETINRLQSSHHHHHHHHHHHYSICSLLTRV